MNFKNIVKNEAAINGQTKNDVSSTKNMFGRDIFLMDELLSINSKKTIHL